MNITEKKFFIVAITPYFLERESFQFKKNDFFQKNTIFLKENSKQNLSFLINKLSSFGYEKVQKVEKMGEFSHLGGTLYVFPINCNNIFSLDFLGNKLETIKKIPANESFAENRKFLIKKIKRQKSFFNLAGLKPNDFIVHIDHGVGIFEKKVIIENREYYLIKYAKEDKLYVPSNLERKLSKYLGFTQPRISRLGSNLWQKKKRKIKKETEKLAKELLLLAKKRKETLRSPYFPDDEITMNLASTFQYQETPDQIKALQELSKDLEKDKPVDRIICGDVGFGKTEIALRAMVKSVNSGRQAVMICPTTILANQHYHNFKKRLKKLPIKIAMLSRLQTKKEQKKIIKNIGKIDIIIATHRVFSKDVFPFLFKSGGILIIDEEQRFGVKQKEKFKQLRSSLDVVSLSATPIPRTLYMALANLKEISTIQTPPKNRKSIKTFVAKYDEEKIKKAINFELKRKGQVYFLHNRVQNIKKVKNYLEKLIPKAKIGIIHGKLKEKKLIEVINNFERKKIDVLISTTIIENGLDFPNVNTLIVSNSTLLGLAQAYQIKGRVGRSYTQAYAYFFHPKRLTEKASQRLKALKEAESIGSGYQIALKDLEIRGAGNVIGKEQSGSINQVGLNLYCQILAESIENFKNYPEDAIL